MDYSLKKCCTFRRIKSPICVILIMLIITVTLWPSSPENPFQRAPPIAPRLQAKASSVQMPHDPAPYTDINWLNPNALLVDVSENSTKEPVPVSYAVHTFYYAWYNTPEPGKPPTTDRNWVHWNHPRLPHWIARVASAYSTKVHEPPADVASRFLPKIGLYASQEHQVIHAHLRMLRFAGIGVLVLSWYPAGMADDVGEPMDHLVPVILNLAHEHGIKVALHIEPYKGRTVESVRNDLLYAYRQNYTRHPAYYKVKPSSMTHESHLELPVFFVYDSYRIQFIYWSRLLTPGGDLTIRGKPENAYVIGLLVDTNDCQQFRMAGFNGGYTYFIGRKSSLASSPNNWAQLSSQCRHNGVHFYPSVGPGYDDLSVRPWNERAVVEREDGTHFQRMLARIPSETNGIGITSFNEWHEGTQIEPAAESVSLTYLDYSPFSEEFYLRMVRKFVNKYANLKQFPQAFMRTTQSELEAINQI